MKAKKQVGFATFCSPRHIRVFYQRLIEYLAQELGQDFEVATYSGSEPAAEIDGEYSVLLFETRQAADRIVEQCTITRSMLVDHGPIHSNRTAACRAHFEVFSSPYLKSRYAECGLGPTVRGWSGGYFLTDFLDCLSPRRDECLVYLLGMKGWAANSLTEYPFSEEETIEYLRGLAGIFKRVHVVTHLNSRASFVAVHREALPRNIMLVENGPHFWSLINNVSAVFFEYSSVFAIALWNPGVRLFQRAPKYPCGPIALHATVFHEVMDEVSYRIEDDDLSDVRGLMEDDPKRARRQECKDLIFDPAASDPYAEILKRVREAVEISNDAG